MSKSSARLDMTKGSARIRLGRSTRRLSAGSHSTPPWRRCSTLASTFASDVRDLTYDRQGMNRWEQGR